MVDLLRIGVIASAIYVIVALSFLVLRTNKFGTKVLYAPAQGSAARGIWYAFTRGMLPWEKESTAKHLPTYFAGILFHVAIAVTLLYLMLTITSSQISSTFFRATQVVMTVGLLCGIGLLIKRIAKPTMKAISCADDFLSNFVVVLFLTLALLSTLDFAFMPWFFAVAIVLFLYIPAGKIRHCFFFFYSRVLFGIHFGRRGVLKHQTLQPRSDTI